jgi:hypothetical protein
MYCQREGREGAGVFAFYGAVCMREKDQAAVCTTHQVHVVWGTVVWQTGETKSFRVSFSAVGFCFGQDSV